MDKTDTPAPGSPEWLRDEAKHRECRGDPQEIPAGLRAAAERIEELERQVGALRKAIREADVVARYERKDGHRDWWTGGEWLYPDNIIVCMSAEAFDAARKEGA